MTTSTRRTGAEREKVMAILDRDSYRCIRCCKPIVGNQGFDWSIHHRKPRGRGGDNSLSNLIPLCGSGTTGCHGWVESNRYVSYFRGWLVHTYHTPAVVPVLFHDGFHDQRWVLLDDQGGSSPLLREVADG